MLIKGTLHYIAVCKYNASIVRRYLFVITIAKQDKYILESFCFAIKIRGAMYFKKSLTVARNFVRMVTSTMNQNQMTSNNGLMCNILTDLLRRKATKQGKLKNTDKE